VVNLGDGHVRIKGGKRLEHAMMSSDRAWESWGSTGLSSGDNQRPALPRKKNTVMAQALTLTFHDKRPARPPELATGKRWFFVGPGDLNGGVGSRRFIVSCSENDVVVFQEGLAFPTRELVSAVNNAHAVLVLRGTEDYLYLHDDFVLSADEEESLVKWGVGRPLFGNSLLAVGGTLLVAFAEQVWKPAAVGTLLVVAAGYRVQGVMTKVYRVMSKEWKDDLLVPSGIHGVERAVQFVVVTLVALADLLDDRDFRLAALSFASVQVALLEFAGQMIVTWGWATYTKFLFLKLGHVLFCAACFTAILWAEYIFAGAFVWILIAVLITRYYRHEDLREKSVILWWVHLFVYVAVVGVAIWGMVTDWNEAELKFSPRLLQLWRWALFRLPVSFWTGLRAVGHWIAVIQFSICALAVALSLARMSICVDRMGNGRRTEARKEKRVFSDYHVSFVPSRNLLEPCEGQQAPRPTGDALA